MASAGTERDHCADCGVIMPVRGPESPAERRCEDCWVQHIGPQPWMSNRMLNKNF